MRVIVEYLYPGTLSTFAESNAVQVENGEPPTAPLYTASGLDDFPLGQEFMANSTYGYFRMTLQGHDENFYSFPTDNDIMAVWNAGIGDFVDFKRLDYSGAGMDTDGGTASMEP